MLTTSLRSVRPAAARVLLLLLVTTASLAAQTSRYDFDALAGSDTPPYTSLDGQDGWTSVGRSQPIPCGVSQTLSWDGTPGLRFQEAGPNFGCDASRINDGSFAFPAFAGSERSAYMQVDMRIGFWGGEFALGHDVNGDGTLRRTQGNETGPRISLGTFSGAQLRLRAADGTSTTVSLADAGLTGATWARLRVVMDLAADGGSGRGSVLVANLTAGTALTPVAGLQDIPLGLDGAATDARNPTLWDAMAVYFEGGGYGLDNVVIGGAAQGMRESASRGRERVTLLAASSASKQGLPIEFAGAGDANADGLDDVVVADLQLQFGTGSVSVLSGADGTSLWSVVFSTNDEVFVVGGGDINGDGFDDVVLVSVAGFAQVFSGLDGAGLDFLSWGTGSGSSAACDGDANGDGFADILVGSAGSGEVFLYSGADGALLQTFSSGAGSFGFSVGFAGDVDGDGRDDAIVGNALVSASTGEASVFSGASGALLRTFAGATPGDFVGSSVDGAGDVDRDGFADLIVGTFDRGARVYSGADGSLIWELRDPSIPFFGVQVAGVGDLDGDGFADVCVGGEDGAVAFSGRDGARLSKFETAAVGSTSVVLAAGGDNDGNGFDDLLLRGPSGSLDSWRFGRFEFPSTATQVHSSLPVAASTSSFTGTTVRVLADYDGDGNRDYAIGSPSWDLSAADSNEGLLEIYSGADDSLILSAPGLVPGESFGTSISSAGDGSSLVLVGSPTELAGAGVVFAIEATGPLAGQRVVRQAGAAGDGLGAAVGLFGDHAVALASGGGATGDGYLRVFDLASGAALLDVDLPMDADGGFELDSAGDVDADGFEDLLVGCPSADNANGTNQGRVLVYSGFWITSSITGGSPAGNGILWDLSYPAGSNVPLFGLQVAGMGDVNGDGHADFAASAPFADENGLTDSGSIFVISGADASTLLFLTGGAANNICGRGLDAGDFDADGCNELVISCPSGAAEVWSVASRERLLIGSGSNANDFGQRVQVGDVNSDGMPDLLVSSIRNGASGFGEWMVFRSSSIFGGTATRFGASCPIANGNLPHAEARGGLYVGSNGFDVDLRAAGPGQATTLLLGTPAPSLPLDLLGLAGCFLHVSQPFLDVPNLTDTAGRASQTFQAPADPGFVGQALDFQWVVVDFTLPTALPLALTDGVRVTFGL